MLAENNPYLYSLNIAKLNKVSNRGIASIGKHCSKLQALNMAGLRKVSEAAMLFLAEGCPGLLMLNVTGCEGVSVSGLKALVEGLGYIELGVSFVGFKPVDDHIEKKLAGNLCMLQEIAAQKITRGLGAVTKKLRIKAEFRDEWIDGAARKIQGAIYRYRCRLHFYWIYFEKKKQSCATNIQRVHRGKAGRRRAMSQRTLRAAYFARSKYVVCMQRVIRGHQVRRRSILLAKRMREMYILRREEAELSIAVRFQSVGRSYLARGRMRVYRELRSRRGVDEEGARLMLQSVARMLIAKARVFKRRSDAARKGELQENACLRIQAFYRACQGRYRLKQSRNEREIVLRMRINSSIIAQRFVRGFFARKRCYKLRIEIATRWFAACTIQRYYRGTRIMRWQDMRLNIIAAYVLDRQYLERRERVAASRVRYKAYVEENRKDSASEEEAEELVLKWEKKYDNVRRRHFWYNEYTDTVTYDEPQNVNAFPKAFVGVRVRIYWVAQRVWYEGTISRYHRRKKRHRVNYDDGDHEWLNLEDERDRIQVQQLDGSWIIYLLYRPPELLDEWGKMENLRANENFRKQAFDDAQQWKILHADNGRTIMFISDRTGEIRGGKDDAADWIIQDDGHGFPCFYNTKSEEIEHDDPRFEEEENVDLAMQKDFVMQELRIAVYFCKDFWERYSAAKDAKRAMSVMMQARNSNKPKHLVAFLIRAKGLYKQVSVVDEPVNPKIVQELEYATWLAERIASIVEEAERHAVRQRDGQIYHKRKLLEVSRGKVYCTHCKRETLRHIEYCKTCGKRQLFLLDKLEDEIEDQAGGAEGGAAKLTKSELFAQKVAVQQSTGLDSDGDSDSGNGDADNEFDAQNREEEQDHEQDQDHEQEQDHDQDHEQDQEHEQEQHHEQEHEQEHEQDQEQEQEQEQDGVEEDDVDNDQGQQDDQGGEGSIDEDDD